VCECGREEKEKFKLHSSTDTLHQTEIPLFSSLVKGHGRGIFILRRAASKENLLSLS
jgi:hypothetical protein